MQPSQAPPTFLPSTHSPTGYELNIYTFAQLDMADKNQLQQRALDLKSALAKCDWVSPAVKQQYRDSLRVHAESMLTIKWCLDVQIAILKNKFSLADFGLPKAEMDRLAEIASPQRFEGNFPTIKKTKESILAESPRSGPVVHDIPLKRPPSAAPLMHGTRYEGME